MTYFIEIFKNLLNKKNTGAFIFLIMNIIVLTFFFSGGLAFFYQEVTYLKSFIIAIISYLISLIIALSPIGEYVLRHQLKVNKISEEAEVYKIFNEVYEKAKIKTPNLNKNIKLFYMNDSSINAFALGRKTIILTDGSLKGLDKEIIEGILAHEFGHLAHKDTDISLMITTGNLILSLFFIVIRGFLGFVFGFIGSLLSKNVAKGLVTFFAIWIPNAILWCWIKIGFLLSMHSSKKNEYQADLYSAKCGYSEGLLKFFQLTNNHLEFNFIQNMVSSHPTNDERIRNLDNFINDISDKVLIEK